MLKARLLTAAVLIPLVVWGTLALHTLWFSLLVALVVALGAWEWSALAGLSSRAMRGFYVVFMLLALWGINCLPVIWVLAAATLGWCAAAVIIVRYPAGVTLWSGAGIAAVAGVWVLAPAWFALTHLHAAAPQGPYWVLFVMVLAWVADSAAYFSGRRWGTTKLAAEISPGKTWAGVWGALVATLLIAPVAGIAFELSGYRLWLFMGLCLVTVVFSIVGDLFKSLYKRARGVKDSGHLLPGHGGVLDRIDSLTAAAPVLMLGLWLMGALP